MLQLRFPLLRNIKFRVLRSSRRNKISQKLVRESERIVT